MKILAIHGSMRKGNTYTLTKEIINRLSAKPNVECTEIHVADLKLPFCLSCHLCFSKGEEYCPNHGIMSGVQSAIMASDGIIVSGATYMWALNAAAKNFLDHLAYWFHRPALFGKKGMVITTSAGNGEKAVAEYIKTVLGQWGVNRAVILTRTAKEQILSPPDKAAAKLDRVADRFYQMIASKRFLSPSLKSIAVHNAFRAMSLSGHTESVRDTQYWQQDSFNKAYPVKAGALKYAAGALIFSLIKLATKMLGRIYKDRITNADGGKDMYGNIKGGDDGK
jgi:multimeric flavodoxin WrbA